MAEPIALRVEGMTCASCAAHIREALRIAIIGSGGAAMAADANSFFMVIPARSTLPDERGHRRLRSVRLASAHSHALRPLAYQSDLAARSGQARS